MILLLIQIYFQSTIDHASFTIFMFIVGFLVMASRADYSVWEGLGDGIIFERAADLLDEVMPNFSELFSNWPSLREMIAEPSMFKDKDESDK